MYTFSPKRIQACLFYLQNNSEDLYAKNTQTRVKGVVCIYPYIQEELDSYQNSMELAQNTFQPYTWQDVGKEK